MGEWSAALVVLCQQASHSAPVLEALFALMPSSLPCTGTDRTFSPSVNSKHPKEWGSYRQRAVSAIGIPIMVTTLARAKVKCPAVHSTATILLQGYSQLMLLTHAMLASMQGCVM